MARIAEDHVCDMRYTSCEVRGAIDIEYRNRASERTRRDVVGMYPLGVQAASFGTAID